MGRRVLIGVSAVLAWLSVASAQPTAGAAGSVEITSNGARYGQCEVLEFPAANYSPSRSGNVCSLPLGATVTQLGSVIGDDAAELQQGTALPATCDVGEMYFETDQPVPSTSADVCWMYVCTATNTWECLGDVNSGGRTGGQSIAGGAAADENLTLQSTANSDRGSIRIDPNFAPTDSTENIVTSGWSFSSSSAYAVREFNLTPSLTCSGTVGHTYRSLRAAPTVSNGTGLCLLGSMYLFEAAPSLSVTSASTNMPAFRGLYATPTFTVSNVSAASESADTFGAVTYLPTLSVTGASGAWTKGADGGLFYKPTLTTDTVGGVVTLTDSYGALIQNAAASGNGTETLTRQNGVTIEALTTGASNFPVRIGEAAASATGTVPSGYAVITATTGSPSRITVVNENQQRFDVGYVTWTGSTGAALAADNTSRYFPANDRSEDDGAANTTLGALALASEGEVDVPMPGAATVVYMACAVNVAPANGAGTQTRTFTLREAAAGTAVTCTISEAATSCTWCQTGTTGCSGTGTAEAVAAGALVDIEAAAANTPAASDATCTLWWTLNAF